MNSRFLLLCFSLFLLFSCKKPAQESITIVSQDVINFWQAYDKIRSTKDTAQQRVFLQELFLDKVSPGQQAMINARRYTADQYLEVINAYPQFWDSFRAQSLDIDVNNAAVQKGIQKINALYPEHDLPTAYYTIGAFRSPGTGFDSLLLIGSEFALGTKDVVTEEFQENMIYVADYHALNPIEYLEFLSAHEYVHTQQGQMHFSLPALALYEGIAEFVAAEATGKASPFDNLKYGAEHTEEVWELFEEDLVYPWPWRARNWLWNSTENPMKTRDMAYYIGYKAAEQYYVDASDKKAAIKYLIELDLSDQEQIDALYDATGLLDAPMKEIRAAFDATRPTATGLKEFENGSTTVDPTLTTLTFTFSEPMNTYFKSLDFGELGAEHFPTINGAETAKDGLSVTYQVELAPNKKYQMVLQSGYRTPDDRPLMPYTLEFKTK